MLGVLKLVVKFLSHRKLRSFLTTLGVAIGVALVFSIIGINRGLVSSITDLVDGFGDNFATVLPKTGALGTSSSAPFTQREVDLVKKIDFVKFAAGGYATTLPVTIRGEDVFLLIRGGDPDTIEDIFNEIQSYEFELGRSIYKDERKKIVLGYTIADKYSLSPGSQIEIAGEKFRVVGVQKKTGNSQQDNIITANVEDIWDITGDYGEYRIIFVKMKELKTEALKDEMEKIRGSENFDVTTPENLAEQIATILGVVNAIFLSVASISILVGSVNVANTMYMAIAERTRDIGIMKAIGARPTIISIIFMVESGILTMVGASVGIVVGMLVIWSFSYVGDVSGMFSSFGYPLNLDLILYTFIFAFMVGVASGFFPARYAARLEPVVALRKGK
ncbi:MAG: ABC transporter permease [Candidatus Altiarchaeota archaeon]|nr:ABC transporter permease [Candidatus Altiarchaeota archaeon]